MIPYSAMRLVAWVFGYGASKYSDHNWKNLNFASQQDPLNHGISHANRAAEMEPGSIDRIYQEAKAAWNMIARLWYDAKLYREKNGFDPDLSTRTLKQHGCGDEPKDGKLLDGSANPVLRCAGGTSAVNVPVGDGIIWCHWCEAYHSGGVGQCDKHAAAIAATP